MRLIALWLLLLSTHAFSFEIFGTNFGGGNPPPYNEPDYHGPRERSRGRGGFHEDRRDGHRGHNEIRESEPEPLDAPREYIDPSSLAFRSSSDPAIWGIENEKIKGAAIALNDEIYRGATNRYSADAGTALLHALVDFGTNMTPGISWGRTIYEALAGVDAISGRALSEFEHHITIFAALTPFPSPKLAYGGWKMLVRAASQMRSWAAIRGGEIADTIKLFRDNWRDFGNKIQYVKFEVDIRGFKNVRSFINAFLPRSRISTLKVDKEVIRYYIPGKTNPKGPWVTDRPIKDPHSELALPYAGPYEEARYMLRAGTRVMRGEAAPKYGQPGGGPQLLVNPKYLEEIH